MMETGAPNVTAVKTSPAARRCTMFRAAALPTAGSAVSTGSGAELTFTVPSLHTVT